MAKPLEGWGWGLLRPCLHISIAATTKDSHAGKQGLCFSLQAEANCQPSPAITLYGMQASLSLLLMGSLQGRASLQMLMLQGQQETKIAMGSK